MPKQFTLYYSANESKMQDDIQRAHVAVAKFTAVK